MKKKQQPETKMSFSWIRFCLIPVRLFCQYPCRYYSQTGRCFDNSWGDTTFAKRAIRLTGIDFCLVDVRGWISNSILQYLIFWCFVFDFVWWFMKGLKSNHTNFVGFFFRVVVVWEYSLKGRIIIWLLSTYADLRAKIAKKDTTKDTCESFS